MYHHRSLTLGAALTALMSLSSAWAATDVGVSVQVNQPGVYGRIDIGNTARPTVINTAPVVVMPAQPQPQQRQIQVQAPEPVYMWVPPGHQRNWKRHCREYNACNQPVYFVQDQWYRDNIRGSGQGRDYEERRHNEHRRHDRDERRDDGDRDEHGHGEHGKHGKHRD